MGEALNGGINPLSTSTSSAGGGFWSSFFNALPGIGAAVVGGIQAANQPNVPHYNFPLPGGGVYSGPTPPAGYQYGTSSLNLGNLTPLLLIGGLVVVAVLLVRR